MLISVHRVAGLLVEAAAADSPLAGGLLRALHGFLRRDVAAAATDGRQLEEPQLPSRDEVVQVAVAAVPSRHAHAQAPAPAER